MDRGDSDAGRWPPAGRPGALTLASYLTAEPAAAAQYRLIVDVLLDEQERSLAGVSRPGLDAAVRDRLDVPWLATLPLDRRLDQLVGWGVADQWPGPGGVPHYQLTEAAARLHRAVRGLAPGPAAGSGSDLGGSVAASVAPPVLAGHLARLAAAVPGQPGEAAAAWSVLRTTLGAMTDAATGWQARLAAALAGAADPARVAALQDTLRRYVDVWGTGVDRHSGPIAGQAAGLLDAGPAAWRPAALHSLGAAATEDQLSALLDDYRATLTGLLAWFGPGDNRARRLRRQMRDVVVPLVHGQRALAAVRGQLSRRADLLALAGALERTATDDDAWSLWCTATGLFAARHLPHPSPQPPGPAGSVSFWAAEPVPPSLLAAGPLAAGPLAAGPAAAGSATAGLLAADPIAAGSAAADPMAAGPSRPGPPRPDPWRRPATGWPGCPTARRPGPRRGRRRRPARPPPTRPGGPSRPGPGGSCPAGPAWTRASSTCCYRSCPRWPGPVPARTAAGPRGPRTAAGRSGPSPPRTARRPRSSAPRPAGWSTPTCA